MKVLNHVDLGKAFESLKKSIIDTEIELKVRNEKAETTFDRSCNYAYAYGRLSGAITGHIAGNTDTNYGFLQEAIKEDENHLETNDNSGAMAD